MTDTFKKLDQRLLTSTSATLLYQAPASTQTIIKQIKAVNVGSSACTLQLYNPAAAASVAKGNVILPPISIDAGGFAEFDGTITLAANETIYAQSSTPTSSITITLYGLEIS